MKDNKKFLRFVLPAIILIFAALILISYVSNQPGSKLGEGDVIEVLDSENGEIKVTEDGTRYIVHPSRIKRGINAPGNLMDVIPPIDNPKYISVAEADEIIEDEALVLAIVYKGVERVYPYQIMTFHEIVNDDIAGDPILITYCPLCGSGIAYERKIDGEEVEFGTSGKLYSSNLVMYDRLTQTYWSQIDGVAILGDLAGQELTEVSLDTVTWGEWKAVHPNSEVLSQDTGFVRNYNNNPYSNYFLDDFLFFQSVENQDNTRRIQNKEFVFGVEIDGQYKAYRQSDVDSMVLIEDTFAGVNLRLERQNDGRVIVTNVDTGEEIVKEVDFWFAWYGFHPESELYGFE